MKNKFIKNNKGYIEWELLAVIGLMSLVVAVIVFPVIGIITGFGFPDKGEHIGYVTAIEQGGFSNDYTAYVKTELESSQEDKYCVKDLTVVEKLKDKAKSKENVVIEYRRGWFEPITVCNGESTVIIGVSEIN